MTGLAQQGPKFRLLPINGERQWAFAGAAADSSSDVVFGHKRIGSSDRRETPNKISESYSSGLFLPGVLPRLSFVNASGFHQSFSPF
jgi:hypothetical protein